MSDWRGEDLIRNVRRVPGNAYGNLIQQRRRKAGIGPTIKRCKTCGTTLHHTNRSGLCAAHYAEIAANNLPGRKAK